MAKQPHLPGTWNRVLSFLPMLNWIALLCLGVTCKDGFSLICGLILGVLSIIFPVAAPFLWVWIMIHYALAYGSHRKKIQASPKLPFDDPQMYPPSPQPPYEPAFQPAQKPTPQPAYKPTPQPAQKPAQKPTPQPAYKPTPQPAQKPAQKPTPQPAYKPTPQPAQKPAQKPTPQPAYKPTPQPAQKPAPKTTSQTTQKPAPKSAPQTPSAGSHTQPSMDQDTLSRINQWLGQAAQRKSQKPQSGSQPTGTSGHSSTQQQAKQVQELAERIRLAAEKIRQEQAQAQARAQATREAPKPPVTAGRPAQTRQAFLEEIRRHQDKTGLPAPFVPCPMETVTYETMAPAQRAWYFYWRTQARLSNYLETDIGYLTLYCQELIQGAGPKDPEEACKKMLDLLKAYGNTTPIRQQLMEWTIGLAYVHKLDYAALALQVQILPQRPVVTNLLVQSYAKDRPLKLPWYLLRQISNYSAEKGKFAKDGYGPLLQEAFPRIIALVDAALYKKTGKGYLDTYGPPRPKKQEYDPFQGLWSAAGTHKQELTFPAYVTSKKLTEATDNFLRYGENVLRSLKGCRGRLQGVDVEESLAELIKNFLTKEYGQATAAPSPKEPARVQLDFAFIRQLREESDQVRDALNVELDQEQKEKLTDLAAVLSVIQSLSPTGRTLLEHMSTHQWQCAYGPVLETAIAEINSLSQTYLARDLLVRYKDQLLAEEDYEDELDFIYSSGLHQNAREEPAGLTSSPAGDQDPPSGAGGDAQPAPDPAPAETDPGRYFRTCDLAQPLRDLVEALEDQELRTLHLLLTREDPMEELEALAEESFSMPELLLDQLNERAMEFLDDILVEMSGDVPQVLAQYQTQLREALL